MIFFPTSKWTFSLLGFRLKPLTCCFTSVGMKSLTRHLHSPAFLDPPMEGQDRAAHSRAWGMTRLAAWTPTDAASDCAPRSTSVNPLPRRPSQGNIFDPLKTTSVWSKNQMRKFPSFMSRRKRGKKKTLFAQGLCQEADLFFFLTGGEK